MNTQTEQTNEIKTKEDYKKMTTKDLLSLISEQALNVEVNEGHKLIIQDVVKQLFNNNRCQKYRKVSYYVVRKFNDCSCGECGLDLEATCDCDAESSLMSYPRVRIMPVRKDGNFPNVLPPRYVNKEADRSIDSYKKTYVITKIEDI